MKPDNITALEGIGFLTQYKNLCVLIFSAWKTTAVFAKTKLYHFLYTCTDSGLMQTGNMADTQHVSETSTTPHNQW